MPRTDFVERSPLTRTALEFAERHHAAQTRELDGEVPLVTHPIEVADLLDEAGYPDEVVAAGVLHDVLEDTDVEAGELDERFGPEVARLVVEVSDDPAIEEEAERKAALRRQVAKADERVGAVFAADKISKARELRLRASRRGRFDRGDRLKLEHYEASLEMLTELLPEHPFLDRLRTELDALHSLSGRGA
jgi:guanosine-3',5'-bis(diphosphate) 3'-pyrophosphohydrolase